MKNVVFIVGHDFEHPEIRIGGNLDFSKMCLGRLNYLIDYNKIAKPFKATIFNFPRGKVDKYLIESNGFKKPIKNEYIDSDLKFMAITKSMYGANVFDCKSETNSFNKHAFKRDNPEVLSICNVYNYITKIGEVEKESIVELSFFSHSYYQGPIFVNSYDSNCDTPDRDDNDKDCRALKDFNDTNLSKDEKKKFSTAFNPNGAIWIYGCDMMKPFIQLFNRITSDKNYDSINPESELTLVKVNSRIADYISSGSSMSIAEKGNLIKNNRRYLVKEKDGIVEYADINVKFKYIKEMLLNSLKVTYAGQIARIANVNTFAALLGTESELFEKVKYPHMAIRTQGYRQILRFYEKHLGIEFDKEGTYYANFHKIIADSL